MTWTMAEKALNDDTSLQSTGQYQGDDTNRAPGTTKSNASNVSKGREDKSVRPKEKVDSTKITKSGLPGKTHHISPKYIASHFGKRQDGSHQHGQRGQRQQIGSRAEGRQYSSKTPSKTGSRGRAVEVEGCGTLLHRDRINPQPFQRGNCL